MQTVQEGSHVMLRLDDGQDLFAAIGQAARERGIRAAAVVSGIGMIKAADLGYWTGREYEVEHIDTPHELVGLQGSIASLDEGPSIHLHAQLANPHHQVIGGHLLRATVAVVGEVCLETFPGRTFGRPMNESLGLRTLDLDPGPI
ncbi:MAG: DNA-binding protein [Thermoplasmata archaeon]|nr:DNA-binding protein [Thermoplasmata archaeon]